ncbi:MAG: CopG family transcriptional regulator [Bryobacteraceae bacterium]
MSKEPTMTLTIELSDNLDAALKAQARAKGVSEAGFVRQVLEQALTPAVEKEKSDQPFETGYGMWAKYGPAPSAEEIDANRRDMFRNFAQDF